MTFSAAMIIVIYVAFVVIVTTFYLVRLSRWIKREAQDNKSKALKKTVSKNNYLIANAVLAVIMIIFYMAAISASETPITLFGAPNDHLESTSIYSDTTDYLLSPSDRDGDAPLDHV